jgi:hypothetical protein
MDLLIVVPLLKEMWTKMPSLSSLPPFLFPSIARISSFFRKQRLST